MGRFAWPDRTDRDRPPTQEELDHWREHGVLPEPTPDPTVPTTADAATEPEDETAESEGESEDGPPTPFA